MNIPTDSFFKRLFENPHSLLIVLGAVLAICALVKEIPLPIELKPESRFSLFVIGGVFILIGARKKRTRTRDSNNKIAPVAEIENVNVEHNVRHSGNNGMKIHVKFSVSGRKGKKGSVVVFFYYDSGKPLKDKNRHYRDKGGNVSASKDFSPSYSRSEYSDFEIFFPYYELHLDGEKKRTLQLQVCVYDSVNRKYVAWSDYVRFRYGEE